MWRLACLEKLKSLFGVRVATGRVNLVGPVLGYRSDNGRYNDPPGMGEGGFAVGQGLTNLKRTMAKKNSNTTRIEAGRMVREVIEIDKGIKDEVKKRQLNLFGYTNRMGQTRWSKEVINGYRRRSVNGAGRGWAGDTI